MYTNQRRGFKTREAAEDYQIQSSYEPAYCSLRTRDLCVVDWGTRASGRVYVQAYQARSKAGDIRTYFTSYIGA